MNTEQGILNSEVNFISIFNIPCSIFVIFFISYKKNSRPISRVLYSTSRISIIYLNDLPPNNERAALNCWYIWSLNLLVARLLLLPTVPVSSYLTFSPLLK